MSDRIKKIMQMATKLHEDTDPASTSSKIIIHEHVLLMPPNVQECPAEFLPESSVNQETKQNKTPDTDKNKESNCEFVCDIDMDYVEDRADDPTKDPDFQVGLSPSDSESDNSLVEKSETVKKILSPKQRSDANNIESTETPELVQKKKRVLKGETRAVRKERKDKRNSGKEYKTRKGKIVPQRTMKPLKNKCRNKCQENISEEDRRHLFDDYWSIGDYNRRVSYLASLIEVKNKVASRPRTTTNKRHNRQHTVIYHFQLNGVNMPVCKSCFMATFDETVKFIACVIAKKLAVKSSLVSTDRRGTREPVNKRTAEEIENVRNHINSIPTYESHYTRRDSQKKYLPSYVTLSQLYAEYKEKFPMNPVSRFVYEREFHLLNIKIKQPNKDTCQTCDKLAMQLKLHHENNFSDQLKRHHEEADLAYSSKSTDKEISKSDSTKKTNTFDMQQCLPTPLVQSSLAFYKRQLWTYNLTVHDCDQSQAYCYIWHEALAKRGGDDIASCLYQYIVNDLPKSVTELTKYSDTCTGQNKNSFVVAMCMKALQDSETLQIINHKFLLSGHTHMECDGDHSLIEKKKRKYALPIEHPHDWAQLIRQVGKRNPFIVKEMRQNDFQAFSDLFKGPLVNRKFNNDHNWRHVRWLRFDKIQPGVVFYKISLSTTDIFYELDFKRKSKMPLSLKTRKRYISTNPISDEKKKDLLDLLPYISDTFHDFYKNLRSTTDTPDIYPDSSTEESDS